jgi:SAM-dependent methyltransferase
MDRRRFSTIAHTDHLFCSPVGEEKVDRIIRLMELPHGARVLDLGCGKGELLLRVVERYQGHGIGVDHSPAFLHAARRHAAKRGLITHTDFHDEAIESFEAAPHTFDLVTNLGAIPAHGFEPMIDRMVSLTKPGGLLLVGHGFWKKDPTQAYLQELGATREELGTHEENVATLQKKGLRFLYASVSNDDDWDHYEGLYNRAVMRFVTSHPNDPERVEFTARINDWHETYLKWGRATLGFGMYLLQYQL